MWAVAVERDATVASTYKRIVRGRLHCKGQYRLLTRLRRLHKILIHSNFNTLHGRRKRGHMAPPLFRPSPYSLHGSKVMRKTWPPHSQSPLHKQATCKI